MKAGNVKSVDAQIRIPVPMAAIGWRKVYVRGVQQSEDPTVGVSLRVREQRGKKIILS